ncbi:MAG: hypothetical protein WBIAU1_12270 [Wolbachia endosymbiont of Drosophila biauraria]|nr:MAG: hypothetical protein WBIAU1_12270 [Wolbachia endosymbiont of Drosophila biauraria]
MHVAAANGHEDVVKVLLEAGADPSLKDVDGKTPRDLTKDQGIIQLLEEAEKSKR